MKDLMIPYFIADKGKAGMIHVCLKEAVMNQTIFEKCHEKQDLPIFEKKAHCSVGTPQLSSPM